jgi:hypothetical protein
VGLALLVFRLASRRDEAPETEGSRAFDPLAAAR